MTCIKFDLELKLLKDSEQTLGFEFFQLIFQTRDVPNSKKFRRVSLDVASVMTALSLFCIILWDLEV